MYLLRRAQHTDAPEIIDTHIRSIREICSKDYTPHQIDAWASRNLKPELLCQTMDRDYVWVIEKDSKVRGFSQMALMDETSAEIMGLYLSPEVLGMGAGRTLFNSMKEEALKKGIKYLNLHSTLTAKTFYEKLGFKQAEGKCSVEIRGIDIPCIPMIISLSPF